ncbi:DUF4876 domain-containing protein [Sphingobacterium sp. lm-10]|uniref:DUF4876 domain-containing protein n=1 Tax=Sphingobacterium sp. lm-10 TaxID=2944904 RepID=UPI0020223FFF|nr:DUF4876 domain-containing protein [Sphingobacterium sp. lm-10]MCL7986429.1 DUF4876 domain-containing protein [Sphingobacterium sp. lm-10]
MKTRITLLFTSITLLLLIGCQKDQQQAMPVNVQIQLAVDEEKVPFTVPYDKAEITLQSNANGTKYTLQANANGQIQLNDMVPGVYAVNVSLKLTAAEYTALTGTNRQDDFYLNYALNDKSIFADENFTITLVTSETIGGFVIKQIYYAGSDTRSAATTRDNFIEIYNNTSETLYADSLLVVTIYGKPNRSTDAYSLSNNQFDWSKALEMTTANGDPNEDFVYAKSIMRVPSDGTGKRYRVEAGKSIIVAATAVNHAGSYTDLNGRVITAQDPTLTVDLSQADFEVNMAEYLKRINAASSPLATDVDNLNVPNMDVIFIDSGREWVFTPQTRESYVIVKLDASVNVENLPAYASPITRTISSSTNRYPQIPTQYIIDAVEVETPVVADRLPRRLPQRFDAGAISVPGGPFSSQSVVRKTAKKVNGRRILLDTNNSANDFGFLNRANSSKGESSFID